MRETNIEAVLGMGCLGNGDDPLGLAGTLEVARSLPGLHAVGVADPTRSDPDHLRRVEAVLNTGQVVALKGYLGYLHFPPDYCGYRPYYELAERYRLPFIFHTGDTYSPYAKVRYALPLGVDEVAVDHPRVRFVLAHLGNPWMKDAAEVVYKNLNVWADLSGLVVGKEECFEGELLREALEDVRQEVRRAFRYAERPNRFLYGSDWPLAPMPSYRAFIASIIPEAHHAQVFEENARLLFRV
jgi:predicted TIM-barrel fold metal-dependent hydrolase